MNTIRLIHAPSRLARSLRNALQEPNAVEANRQITRVHRRLGLALERVTGRRAGPNFHSWAVWGSLKAGETISRRPLAQALRDSRVTCTACGIVLATVGYVFLPGMWVAALGLAVGSLTYLLLRLLIGRAMSHSAQAILQGNRTVLADIGAKTVQFLTCFDRWGRVRDRRLYRFLRGFRPGHSSAGGQDLLREAFRYYLKARHAPTQRDRQQAVYYANCLAVLHEHYRLQPYIERAMPRLLRWYATRFMMDFSVGRRTLAVHRDVPDTCPPNLQEISLKPLARLLRQWTRHGPAGVRNWADLGQRMNYIFRLFRALHGTALTNCNSLKRR